MSVICKAHHIKTKADPLKEIKQKKSNKLTNVINHKLKWTNYDTVKIILLHMVQQHPENSKRCNKDEVSLVITKTCKVS